MSSVKYTSNYVHIVAEALPVEMLEYHFTWTNMAAEVIALERLANPYTCYSITVSKRWGTVMWNADQPLYS